MKNQQIILYRYGRVGCFVYCEGNPYPIDLERDTEESATYDQSLLEQKFTDLFFEKNDNKQKFITIALYIAVVIVVLLVMYLIMSSKAQGG